ncbi:MAG TPA: Hint domain-containing homing endonuclease [Bacilli bacterium]|nr:Hint domain-containing homing endonuclease [Bacilli bacterium]
MYKSVPLYNVKLEMWERKDFPTQSSYVDWLWSLWKEPGQYDFDDTVHLFNEQAKIFDKRGIFCQHPSNSKDFVTYWEDQKDKCKNGVIYQNGSKEWFIPREYYMLLNFLKIYNKEKKNFTFIDVRDAQYHMALYEELAEHSGKHVAVLKKRQMLSSYYHAAKLINRFWFDSGAICKLAASLGTYVKDTWRFIDEYRNFLNQHTAWYRPCNPDKALDWQQKIEITQNGKKIDVGLKSVMKGLILDKDPSGSVGGPCHRKGTKILMASGKFKNVEDIKIGEFILGIDNKPKKVIRNFSGTDMIYEVNQVRGESYYTTGDHKLYLINRDVNVAPENKLRITKTKDWNDLTPYRKKVYVGVKNKKPLVFHNHYEEVTLDPYFLGLWLGDGFREKPGAIVNKTKDPELLEYLEQLSETINTKLNVKRKEEFRYNDEMYKASFIISENGNDSYMTQQFIKYNLFYNKHIPDEYLYGSIETRLAVLAGYIDTDGYYDPDKGHFEISCKNDNLFEQVVFLCRSLGAYVTTYRSSSKEHVVNNRVIKYTETNRASIRFINSAIIPTKIKRKQGNSQRERNIHTSPIRNIKEIGIESYYGIEVEDNLYYLHDLTITHNCSIFFYDEAGIAPKMNQTLEFLLPALKSGMSYTGMYIAAGSVGDLKDCEPLEELIRRPNSKDILAVRTNLIDDKGTIGECGLFIPEQWSMLPYVDEYGNSLVEEAVAAILEERERWKKELTPADYQLRISQKPLNIDEAFAAREESPFPLHLISQQIEKIKNNTYYLEHVELDRDIEGKVIITPSRKLPITEFPVRMNAENKEGVIVMHERPVEGAKFGTYYASLDPVSSGKAEWVDNKLITPTGYKRIGDINIGDKVMNPDGKPTKVVGVYPQGKIKLYRISFTDNTDILVSEDHLWAVNSNDGDKTTPHVFSTKQLLDKNCIFEFNGIGRNKDKVYKVKTYYKNQNNQNKWQIPLTKPLIFKNKTTLPVDPYFLGAMLGDGSMIDRSISFSTGDTEMLEYMSEKLPSDITIKKSAKYDYRISTNKSRNTITQELRKLGLMGHNCYNKFIPVLYLRASIKDRLNLLRGLMDTDGWIDKNKNGCYFGSTFIQLANNVAELVRSLGGTASITIKKRIKNTQYATFYNVRINLPQGMNPFRLKRKADNYKIIRRVSKYIKDIKFERIDDAICIEVENQNNLYLTENYIVTHNTTTSNSLASVYIYKNATEVTIVKDDGKIEHRLEKGKLVCWWTGRFDDLKMTHQRIEMMLELYNAWCVIENNVSQFIQYMQERNKQRYLVPKDQLIFLKDIKANTNVYQEYGWRNVNRIFKDTLLPYGIGFLTEPLDIETKVDGEITKTYYGIERIPDIMLLKEMQAYKDSSGNYDRLIAYCALTAFIAVQIANKGNNKERRYETKNLDKSKNNSNLVISPFKSIGNKGSNLSQKGIQRSAFKKLR